MSGKKLSTDEKAKRRLARHIIGGDKQEMAEKTGKACPYCGSRSCKEGTNCSEYDRSESGLTA